MQEKVGEIQAKKEQGYLYFCKFVGDNKLGVFKVKMVRGRKKK